MISKRRVRERLAHRAMRTVGVMPGEVQVALSGRRRVIMDGQELDPGVQLLLAANARRDDPPVGSVPAVIARKGFERRVAISNGKPERVGDVRDLVVAGASGGLAARLYVPEEPTPKNGLRPLLVFFHGGGFVFGSIETHDVPCRLLCKHSGASVLSVDYGLAPEHPFPEPVEDATAALGWAMENARSLGCDPGRVAVGGDSAGAALASNAAAHMVGEGRPSVLQLLIYPVTDVSGRTHSREMFADGFILDQEIINWFQLQYAPDGNPEDPRLSVGRISSDVLAAMPPTVIVTAGFDPLRDEGEEYADVLSNAGVPVVTRRFPGLVHGFANFVGVNRTSRDAVVETAGMARTMLGATEDRR